MVSAGMNVVVHQCDGEVIHPFSRIVTPVAGRWSFIACKTMMLAHTGIDILTYRPGLSTLLNNTIMQCTRFSSRIW
jgi:hypothetical protein